MVPSVNLDDIQDKNQRKLMIDFIYQKTIDRATKEIWGDFKIQPSLYVKRYTEEQQKPVIILYNYYKFAISFIAIINRLNNLQEIDRKLISRLPVRFQGAARKWDSMQCRSFLENDICYDKKIKRKNAMYVKEKYSQ